MGIRFHLLYAMHHSGVHGRTRVGCSLGPVRDVPVRLRSAVVLLLMARRLPRLGLVGSVWSIQIRVDGSPAGNTFSDIRPAQAKAYGMVTTRTVASMDCDSPSFPGPGPVDEQHASQERRYPLDAFASRTSLNSET